MNISFYNRNNRGW